MKQKLNVMRLFVSTFILLSCSMGFVSCSDDDDPKADEQQVTVADVYGAYEGMMYSEEVVAESDEQPEGGLKIKLDVDQETINFSNFPIYDLVYSIVGDEETAKQIVEAVGEVNYQIDYQATVSSDNKSVVLQLDPKPLQLELVLAAGNEETEAQKLLVQVTVEAAEEAVYDAADSKLTFAIQAKEVLLGEGDAQVAFPGFKTTAFTFDMNQCKVAHN